MKLMIDLFSTDYGLMSLAGLLFWGETLPSSAWAGIVLIILSGVGATHFSRAKG